MKGREEIKKKGKKETHRFQLSNGINGKTMKEATQKPGAKKEKKYHFLPINSKIKKNKVTKLKYI